jgi:ankyrin repeat protein
MRAARFGVVGFVLLSVIGKGVAQSPVQAQQALPPAAIRSVDYVADVKPLLSQNCYGCHGPEVQQAGLRLDLRQNALRGGDYGPVIVPGKSGESKLIHRLVSGDGGMQMPPTGALLPDEIGLLRAWIDQGADFRNDVADEAPPRPIDPRLATLIAAVRSGSTTQAEAALATHRDLVNAADPGGSTPLHHAAGFGAVETLTRLLDAGANVNAVNRRRSAPLHWAIHDDAKVALLLARGAPVNARDVGGRTALYQAASLGDARAMLRRLLAAGADANLGIANGRTPLMAAASRGDVESMRALIEAGAVVDARNGAGETALILAAGDGNTEAVRFLVERGADVRARTKRNETALGNAATTGNEAVVRLLLERGAEVNVRNFRGYSPLMLAAASDAMPAGIVRMLLARGADTSFVGDYDETARDLAAKRGNTEVTRLLGGLPPARPAAVSSHAAPAAARSIPDAVEQALTMAEKQSFTFIRVGGCNSCHSQELPSAAVGFARSRGLRVPREIPQLPQAMMPSPERLMDFNGIVSAPSLAWELVDFGMNGVPKSAFTDAAVRGIKALQSPEGHWSANESRRPPMNAGDFQAAAVSIYALAHYTPAGGEASTAQAITRAVGWLERSTPLTTQDRAFHALALAWAGPSSAPRAQASARTLIGLQRPDGGWSQLDGMPSDAYATGQALFALAVAGQMAPTDPTYRKGVDYLLKTQAADGTWHVRTRAIWLQPYFESGFPYGRDQFISTAGTAWAAMALAAAAPAPTTSVAR